MTYCLHLRFPAEKEFVSYDLSSLISGSTYPKERWYILLFWYTYQAAKSSSKMQTLSVFFRQKRINCPRKHCSWGHNASFSFLRQHKHLQGMDSSWVKKLQLMLYSEQILTANQTKWQNWTVSSASSALLRLSFFVLSTIHNTQVSEFLNLKNNTKQNKIPTITSASVSWSVPEPQMLFCHTEDTKRLALGYTYPRNVHLLSLFFFLNFIWNMHIGWSFWMYILKLFLIDKSFE